MSDEIKEKIKAYYVANDINEILYYITNLQEELEEQKRIEQADFKIIQNLEEENERLKKENIILKENAEHNDKVVDKARWNEMIYKSRCEKAIEYINQNKHLSMFADCREPEEDWNYDLEIDPRELLNILTGGEKE